MRDSAFVFLRATYWRWAETILVICGDLTDAPAVIGVGDIHLENYGVWRDREGRLVWGVNDFDEAARMPYALDLVRLAASALLSLVSKSKDSRRICSDILAGYRGGLRNPRPFILDERHRWLRTLLVVADDERAKFWKKMDDLRASNTIPDRYKKPIERAMPGSDATIVKFARRRGAGTGSLGRPRWVGVGEWRGGRWVREVKALVPSAWTRAHPDRSQKSAAALISAGRYRAPDPWYELQSRVVVRRLSPNARKIEVKDQRKPLSDPEMLGAMGHELANLHLGTGDWRKPIEKDLDRRRDKWLERAAETAAEFVSREFEKWS